MSDSMPRIALTFGEEQKPVVYIGTQAYSDWGEVVQSSHDTAAPENASKVARMMTHFSYRTRYRVIDDAAEYEALYRSRIEAEEPGQPYEQNVIRSRSFGIPDFSAIAVPAIAGETLTYYVYDTALFVPYRVEASPTNPNLTAQTYTPLPLEPAT